MSMSPANASSHSFRVRAKSGNCAGAWSDASSAADENLLARHARGAGGGGPDPCSLTGVQITWGAVSGATSYDIFVDETTILSGVSSPYTRLPGNSNSHSYQVRAWRSGCKGDWSAATAETDVNGLAMPAAPTVTDLDPCAQSGVSVSWTAVPGATAYDLIVDGTDLVAGVTSPTTYDPRNTANHDYSIQARALGCTGDRSNPTTKGDQDKRCGRADFFQGHRLSTMRRDRCLAHLEHGDRCHGVRTPRGRDDRPSRRWLARTSTFPATRRHTLTASAPRTTAAPLDGLRQESAADEQPGRPHIGRPGSGRSRSLRPDWHEHHLDSRRERYGLRP